MRNDKGRVTLTPEQLDALDAFRARNGRSWKEALRTSWERARYPHMAPDHAAALQQIRNALGPEWLSKYRPRNIAVDGLDEAKNFSGDGTSPPFVVFDADLQRNIAGPFPDREAAEQHRLEIHSGQSPRLDTARLAEMLAQIDEGIVPSFETAEKLPDSQTRLALAEQFYDELSDSVEVFSDIVDQHGARTLADLFHLHASIMTNGFIDAWPDSAVLEVVAGLPSAERWLQYASVYDEDGLEKKQSIFSKARDRAVDHEAAQEQPASKVPRGDDSERLEGVKARLSAGGDDPKWLDQMLQTLRAQNVKSLDDEEIDRAFGSVMLSHFCIQYVKAARSCGLTVDDVYLIPEPTQAARMPKGKSPMQEGFRAQEHGAPAQQARGGAGAVQTNVAQAEQRLQALGLHILSDEDIAAWNQEKNAHGSLYPDVELKGWVEQDGFLTKEFYVRDPDGAEAGLYRKAWYGDYAGGDDKELLITDVDGKELGADLEEGRLEP